MTQEWTVGVIVLAAAAYALWYWLPAGLRRRLAGFIRRWVINATVARATPAVACDDLPAAKAAEVQHVRWLPGSTDRHHPD